MWMGNVVPENLGMLVPEDKYENDEYDDQYDDNDLDSNATIEDIVELIDDIGKDIQDNKNISCFHLKHITLILNKC